MKAREMLVEFYDMANDDLEQWNYDDTRRPRLTLGQLHKMRLAKDAERADKADHLAFLPTMYNQSTGLEGE
jgi:hypothetical protein